MMGLMPSSLSLRANIVPFCLHSATGWSIFGKIIIFGQTLTVISKPEQLGLNFEIDTFITLIPLPAHFRSTLAPLMVNNQ